MKFGKNLTRAVAFSNAEWIPFWTNYKLLKKIIKDLPAVVPSDPLKTDDGIAIRKNPKEVIFFKHIRSEFEKVSSFFSKAKKELKIRYERVMAGKEILCNSHAEITPDRWIIVCRSAYKLHKSLLLLEAFAIMNYCAFSKILKKHDKRTGYSTKVAFMTNVVNKSNFASYPDVLAMIQGCKVLIDESSKNLKREEQPNLREDAKLLVGMAHKIKNTEDGGTKGDPAVNKKGDCQGDTALVSPIPEKATITLSPRELETVLKDLNKIRRLRSVSDYSIVSESSITPINKLKDCDTVESFYGNDKKHNLAQTTFERSKKQRCI